MHRWVMVIALSCSSGVLVAGYGGRLPIENPHTIVKPDRVLIGETEFVPRFATFQSNSLVVPAGEVVTLPPDSTWDAIEVAGTLAVSRTHDTTVRFIHLIILPGGRLDVGTEADPVLTKVELVVRDVPIDTSRDPFQWGNGIINFGTQTRVGEYKTPFVELSEDAPAGATTLTLASVPTGWQVGDELLLPDMRQAGAVRGAPVGRESPVRIAAIAGNVVTLSKGLDFAHASVTDPDGGLVLRPRVANLSRNIVVRSENPHGVRGHTANVGHTTSWDVRGNQFIGMGRTRNEARDSTSADLSHIGTNQIARYADHDHHAESSLAVRRSVANSYVGVGPVSWAKVVHATHDTVVEDNVCVDFQGGCFVSEDGYEVRNVFRRNVAAYSSGNGRPAQRNVQEDCPGCEGSGFWFRGLHNLIEDNEAWNNAVGINLFSKLQVNADVPEVRGGAAKRPFDADNAVPVSFRGNVTIANDKVGLEYWGSPPFPAARHVSAHNREAQVWGAQLNGNNVVLKDAVLIASGGRSECIRASSAYLAAVEVDGGQLRGCHIGIGGGMAIQSVRLRGVVLQNIINLVYSGLGKPAQSILQDVLHLPLGENPKQYIRYGSGAVWQPGQPVGKFGFEAWRSQPGPEHVIINWQGTGEDYVLMANQQRRSTPAWPANVPGSLTNAFFVPEAGLTMGEAWDKYGMAFGGDVVGDDAAIELEGLAGGVARAGLDRAPAQPRAVLTVPNMLGPASVKISRNGPSIQLFVMLTGHSEGASPEAVISIDGGRPVRLGPSRNSEGHRRYVSTAVAPGTHEVRTWREDLRGKKIPGSELVFHYFVQDAAPSTSPGRARR
jgi:hypothetical protein